ncbi:EamA family transporter [Nocardioides daejeonensis]|uniref:EamA family transporter n=1 Tax=Nocardioides daejeonensis TaxID=1046556 RepID=UPI00194E85B3|nr:EamA family transporter [Nocardioides daejeonensis]
MTATIEPTTAPRRTASVAAIAVALLLVYVIWGSTYLGIRVVVEDVPPMLGMGARFLCAAALLALVLGLRKGFGALRVSRAELLGCGFLGLMLPVLGNGVVALGESKGAPSGLTALLVATAPLTIMVFRAATGDRPGRWSVLGVLIGLVGVAFLVLTSNSSEQNRVPLVATLLVLMAATFWAFGSWYQPRLTMPTDPLVATVHEMWTGGVILLLFGFLRGERAGFTGHPTQAWVAWVYLVVFGSMVGYTAYVWLLANAPISLVATYAYVNPVVAVALGALILDEVVTGAMLVGGLLIVVAVAVVISVERPRVERPDEPAPVEP